MCKGMSRVFSFLRTFFHSRVWVEGCLKELKTNLLVFPFADLLKKESMKGALNDGLKDEIRFASCANVADKEGQFIRTMEV